MVDSPITVLLWMAIRCAGRIGRSPASDAGYRRRVCGPVPWRLRCSWRRSTPRSWCSSTAHRRRRRRQRRAAARPGGCRVVVFTSSLLGGEAAALGRMGCAAIAFKGMEFATLLSLLDSVRAS